MTSFEGRSRAEILDGFNVKNSSFFPDKGARLHISGHVKIRGDLNIHFDIVFNKATFPIIIYFIEQMYCKNTKMSIAEIIFDMIYYGISLLSFISTGFDYYL